MKTFFRISVQSFASAFNKYNLRTRAYGPGFRLYFVRRGRVVVVLLNAGDKSTQRRDIRRAVKLSSELGDDL